MQENNENFSQVFKQFFEQLYPNVQGLDENNQPKFKLAMEYCIHQLKGNQALDLNDIILKLKEKISQSQNSMTLQNVKIKDNDIKKSLEQQNTSQESDQVNVPELQSHLEVLSEFSSIERYLQYKEKAQDLCNALQEEDKRLAIVNVLIKIAEENQQNNITADMNLLLDIHFKIVDLQENVQGYKKYDLKLIDDARERFDHCAAQIIDNKINELNQKQLEVFANQIYIEMRKLGIQIDQIKKLDAISVQKIESNMLENINHRSVQDHNKSDLINTNNNHNKSEGSPNPEKLNEVIKIIKKRANMSLFKRICTTVYFGMLNVLEKTNNYIPMMKVQQSQKEYKNLGKFTSKVLAERIPSQNMTKLLNRY